MSLCTSFDCCMQCCVEAEDDLSYFNATTCGKGCTMNFTPDEDGNGTSSSNQTIASAYSDCTELYADDSALSRSCKAGVVFGISAIGTYTFSVDESDEVVDLCCTKDHFLLTDNDAAAASICSASLLQKSETSMYTLTFYMLLIVAVALIVTLVVALFVSRRSFDRHKRNSRDKTRILAQLGELNKALSKNINLGALGNSSHDVDDSEEVISGDVFDNFFPVPRDLAPVTSSQKLKYSDMGEVNYLHKSATSIASNYLNKLTNGFNSEKSIFRPSNEYITKKKAEKVGKKQRKKSSETPRNARYMIFDDSNGKLTESVISEEQSPNLEFSI